MARYDSYEIVAKVPISDGEDITLFDFLTPDWTALDAADGTLVKSLSDDEATRMWIASQNNYGVPDFSDEIHLFNALEDPLAIKTGIKVRLPTINDIQRFRNRVLTGNPPRLGGD